MFVSWRETGQGSLWLVLAADFHKADLQKLRTLIDSAIGFRMTKDEIVKFSELHEFCKAAIGRQFWKTRSLNHSYPDLLQ